MPNQPRHNPQFEIDNFKAQARMFAQAMGKLLEAWYEVEQNGASVPLADHTNQLDLLEGDTKKFEFPFDKSLEDMVHAVQDWVSEIEGASLKEWGVAREILHAPKQIQQNLVGSEKTSALIAAHEFKRRVGARIIKEAQKAVAEYEAKVGYTLTNEGASNDCYKCGKPIAEGQMELYGEGGMAQHADCAAAAAEAAKPQLSPSQKIQNLPQRGAPKTPPQLGLQPKQIDPSVGRMGSKKQAGPFDEERRPDEANPVESTPELDDALDAERQQEEQVALEVPEVKRSEPAAEPTMEAPAVDAPASFEEATPAAETPVEHAEHTEGEGGEEVAARATLEAELSDTDLIESVVAFLKQESSLGDFEVEEEGAEIAKITIGHDEYYVAANDGAADEKAEAMVKDDLSSQPEIFNQEWLSGYIDESKLRDALSNGVEEEIRQNPDSYGWEPGLKAEEEWEENIDEIEDEGNVLERNLLVPPKEVDETEPDEDWVEEKAKEILRDPMEYLKEIHGDSEYIKEALNMAPINEEKAAEDAVSSDGAGHFLSSEDGTVYDLPNGGVYWKR